MCYLHAAVRAVGLSFAFFAVIVSHVVGILLVEALGRRSAREGSAPKHERFFDIEPNSF
jgi:hypothetical protein